MNEESQLLQHWFTPTIPTYTFLSMLVFINAQHWHPATQTSPNQLLHMDFTQESSSFDLFLVLCPFSLLLFTHFLLSTSLPVLYNPMLLIPNIWLPVLPQTTLKCLPPPRAAEEQSSIFFVFSIIHPHLSTLLFLFAQLLSHALLFAKPWTVANQAPLSMEFFQARMLEWVVIYSSRGSSQPRDQTCVSCIDLQHW